MEDRVKRPLLAIAAAAAIATFSACSRPEPATEAPVGTISNHATVEIVWESDMPSALERARNEGKLVLVNFYADWCVWCKRLESTTLRDAKVATVLQNEVVPLSLDVDGDGRELSNEYRVDGLPTIVVLDADGEEIGRIPGYMPPDSFLERVESFLQQS
jgi:thiol:disulfide interchange protein